jgi:hypothetical protein
MLGVSDTVKLFVIGQTSCAFGIFGFLGGSWELTGRSRRKCRGIKVTKGDLNRLIDDVFHRRFSENLGFVIVDGLLHALWRGIQMRVSSSLWDIMFRFWSGRCLVKDGLKEEGAKRKRVHEWNYLAIGNSCVNALGWLGGSGLICEEALLIVTKNESIQEFDMVVVVDEEAT